MTESKVTLYRLYDESNELLYVGVTRHVQTRLRYHAKHQPWGHKIASQRTVLEYFDTADAAGDAEGNAIESDHPLYNIRGVQLPYSKYPYKEKTPKTALATGPQALSKLRWIWYTVALALEQRAPAIVAARDAGMPWNAIAGETRLSRQQVVNIYRATKGEAQPPA